MIPLALALLALSAPAARPVVLAGPVPGHGARATLPAGEALVRWKNRPYSIAELPEELGEQPGKAAQAWAAWCTEHRYAMELDDGGRVLFVTAVGSKKLSKVRSLAKKTTKRFDKFLPPPAAAEIEIEGEASEQAEWGAGSGPLDRETIVLFVLRDAQDQASLLEELARQQSYLSGWTQSAKNFVGFVLEQPLVGAYLESAAGLKEWRPENELVHRLTELLCLRRFGRQPWWLQQGIAWNAEISIEKGVYCFPYRSEFIYATEHGAWPTNVKGLYSTKDRIKKPLDLEFLTNWSRGSFRSQEAWTAWGAAHFLIDEHGSTLPAFLRELHSYRDEHDRKDNGDGTWQRVLGYEIPLDIVRAMMERHFGSDVLLEAGTYLGKGKAK